MSFFGIPLFVPVDLYIEFVSGLGFAGVSSSAMFLGFLVINIMYYLMAFFVIWCLKTIVIWLLNHFC